jgi:hypothetical protein
MSRIVCGLSVAAAVVVAVILGALVAATLLAVLLLRGGGGTDPDASKAREEVQRWYDTHKTSVRVSWCEWAPGDSESNEYECRVVAPCAATVRFFVPRASVPSRFDADPLPESSRPLRARCDQRG